MHCVSLYDLVREPVLESPILLVCLDGWIDAGGAAQAALQQVIQACSPEPELMIDFDTEELLDYRARRPVMHLVDSINTGLTWPTMQILHGKIDNRDVMILQGAEPDHRWKEFSSTVADLAIANGCQLMVGFGAYPAPSPHTRPTRVVTTSSSARIAAQIGVNHGSLDVPAGVMAAVERACVSRGVTAVGLWGQVPHYVSNMAYPAAAVALLEAFAKLTDISVNSAVLVGAAAETTTRINELVSNSREHLAMVDELERQADQIDLVDSGQGSPLPTELPSGDDLAKEIERFLRNQSPPA